MCVFAAALAQAGQHQVRLARLDSSLSDFSDLPVGARAALPKSVRAALKRANIPLSSVGIVVQQTGVSAPLLSHNARQAMNPASTIKLLTTFAALEVLGPAYQWKTEAYLDGTLENDVLLGNLVFKGYGDPKLHIEQFWLWLRELRQRGLREIRGDIVLDNSFFEVSGHDPAEFDNDPTRTYNVGPNALLLNFNAVHLRLIPNAPHSKAFLNPELSGYLISNRISSSATPSCHGANNYRVRLDDRNIILEGTLPASCGETNDYFSLLPHNDYFFAVFSALWKELGGELTGGLRAGHIPPDQAAFSTHMSPPLAEVIRDINKFSNNIMARQLFLTLGTTTTFVVDSEIPALPPSGPAAASITHSIAATRQWLEKNQLHFPELILDNGAGLSRETRISAEHLADLLQLASMSPYAAELEASLPILGIDGSIKNRLTASQSAGYAHLKSGTLEGVKSLAGYVKAHSGKQWVVVFNINHPYAASGQDAQDALLEWLRQH